MIELTQTRALAGKVFPVLVNPDHVLWAKPMTDNTLTGRTDLLLAHPTGGRIEVEECYEVVRGLLCGDKANSRSDAVGAGPNVLVRASKGRICESEVPLHTAVWAYDNPAVGRLYCCDEHVPDEWVRPDGVITWRQPDEPHDSPIVGLLDDLPGGWYWRYKGGHPGEYDEYLGPFDSPLAAAGFRDGPDDPGLFDSIICHEPPDRP